MAIALVGSVGTASDGSVNTNTLTITVANAVTAGNSIIITAMSTTRAVSSVTDSAGNTYAVDVTIANGTSSTTSIVSCHNCLALAAGNTITITYVGNASARCASADQFSGLANASTLDQTASGIGTDAAPTTAASATTVQADELLIGAISTTTGTFSVGANYTSLAQVVSTGTVRQLNAEYRIVSATGAYVADGSYTTSRTWSAALATYKAAAAAGAAAHAPLPRPPMHLLAR